MSMPDQLFYPVGTVTCIMVFTAHVPHETSNKKTWFGYWKNDGFVKTKNKGRIDQNLTWNNIKTRWIESFINREVHPGESVMKKVTAQMEWCAEAYMDTDYSIIQNSTYETTVRDYAIYRMLGQVNSSSEVDVDDSNDGGNE